MTNKNFGIVIALFVFFGLIGFSLDLSHSDENSLNNSASSVTPSVVNNKKTVDTTSFNEQIIDCNLGKCGTRQLTREQCSSFVCCQIGSSYSVMSSQYSCSSRQQTYKESITPPTPTYYPPSYNRTKTTCCKYCSDGKACGDSCISRSYTCHKAPGCACNR